MKISSSQKFYFILVVDIIYIFVCAQVRASVQMYTSTYYRSEILFTYLTVQYVIFGILLSYTIKLKNEAQFITKLEKGVHVCLLVVIGLLALLPLGLYAPFEPIRILLANIPFMLFATYKEVFFFDILFPVLLISQNRRKKEKALRAESEKSTLE